ncbi:MAG: sugar-binding protein [Spirochaetota bacterium]
MIPRSLAFFIASIGMLAAENLIVNGDFEDAAGDMPKGWSAASYGSQNETAAAASDGAFIRGSISMHLKHANAEKTPGSKGVVILTEKPVSGIQGGSEYTLTFFAKSPSAGGLDAYFYTGAGKKPHFYKMKSFILNGNWTKYTFTAKLMTADDWNDRDLFIRFDLQYGEAYIDGVELSVAAAGGNTAVAPSIQASKYMLVNPGFELGWLGWGPQSYRIMTAPYEEKEIPSAIDTAVKYEGTASLRIEPNGCIGSRRYNVEPGKTYTFSCYAKAEPASGQNRAVRFFVITPTWNISQRAYTVGKDIGTEWKRYSFPVSIPEQGAPFRNTVYIRIDSSDNTVWVDAVQIEKGDMTAYQSGLQAGILTKNELGLFQLAKPEEVSVALASSGGIARDVTVSLVSRDVQSNVLWKKDIPFAATKDELSLKPLMLDNSALGVFETTITVAVPGETPLSVNSWRACVISGAPESAKQNALFGTENTIGGTPAWLEEWNERMANIAGSGFSRVFIWQGTVDDGADPVVLERLKMQLARKKASGKIVMICVGTPRGAKIHHAQPLNDDITETMVNEETALYAAHAGKIAAALTDTVDYYQLLNEPNIWTAHSGSKKGTRFLPAERYQRFIRAGAAAVRAAYPKAKIAANINGIDVNYVDALFAADAAKSIDAFTFHSYRMAPENPSVYDDIKRLRVIIDKYAKGMPLYNDEQYFGMRDMIAHSGEDDRDYYSDTEEEHTGRLLQNYLHHIAADRVPHAQFAVGSTLYRFGMSSPVYFYHAFSGYRFMSQTLFDIKASSALDVNPAVRAFLFERADGVKIVSLNTRMHTVRGGIRNAAADAVYDMNGNRINTPDIPISFIPTYLSFKAGTSADAVLTALKRADLYGFDAPIRLTFDIDGGSLVMNVENCVNKPLTASVTFKKVPNGWQTPAPVTVSALAERATKRFTFPVTEEPIWDREYAVEYTASAGDSILSKRVKLPSMNIPRAAVVIDGDFSDWKNVPSYMLGEDNLSADFSGGKMAHAGPADCSAAFRFAWDDANFYIAVKVTDSVFFTGNGDEGQFWGNDSVQLYFDMQNDDGKFYDANDATYSVGFNKNGVPVAYLDKAPTGRYVGANNVDHGIDDAVKVAWKKTADGYALEMAFPKETLPYMTLKEGSVFAVSLLINDNDGEGRKQGVTLGPKGTEPFGKPVLWKTVRLNK